MCDSYAPCPECDRQRERANEAVSRVEVLQAAVDQRYRIHAELEAALGVIHLDSDQQMEAALERVAALEAECADGDDKIQRWQDHWDRLRINQSELAELLGQSDLLEDERQQLAVLRIKALEAVAEAARKAMGGLSLAAKYFTLGDDWEWGNGDKFNAGKVRHAAKILDAALAALDKPQQGQEGEE